MAMEGGFEQEIAEVTERKAFPLGLSSVLSVTSCWKFQIRAINVRHLVLDRVEGNEMRPSAIPFCENA